MELEQEILSVGKWNGIPFDAADLQSIAEAFAELKSVHKAPLRFGHEKDGMQVGDGYPALGWIEDVFVKGDKLVAKLTHLPEIVFNAIQKKLYRTVSSELLHNVEYKGKKFKWVLDGLALLGADIPAVNNLNDLGAYLSRFDGAMRAETRTVFKTVTGDIQEKPKMAMTDEEKAQLAALQASVTKLTEQNVALTGEVTKFKVADETRLKAEKETKFAADKKAIGDELEALVKDAKIAPAQRDELMSQIKDGDETSLSVARTTLSVLKKSPGVNVKTDEEGKGKTEQDKELEGKSAGEVLLTKTKELMATDGKLTFNAARQRVYAANPELLKKYINENGVKGAA